MKIFGSLRWITWVSDFTPWPDCTKVKVGMGWGNKKECLGVDYPKLRMYKNSTETTILYANLKYNFFKGSLNTGTLHRWIPQKTWVIKSQSQILDTSLWIAMRKVPLPPLHNTGYCHCCGLLAITRCCWRYNTLWLQDTQKSSWNWP